MSRLGRALAALPAAQRRQLARAWILLPAVGVALRLFGIQQVMRFIARRSLKAEASATNLERAQQVGRLVEVAARIGPYRAPCLPRSLTVWWLLRAEGMASTLRVGVRKAGDALQAHAWVECGGHILCDQQEFINEFAPFDHLGASAG